jgi:CRISPR system Cascade subunit CasB
MSREKPDPFQMRKEDPQAEHESFTLLKQWRNDLESDKGGRAALRRAGSISEIMFAPAYYRLLNLLRNKGYKIGHSRQPYLAVIAALTARIKEDAPGRLGKQLGMPRNGERPALSELRMRRILACDDLEELYTFLRRSLAIINDKASISGVAEIVWQWASLNEKRPTDSRRQLAYDYYAEAPIKSKN